MSSTYGSLFRVTTFGESHGAAVGVVIDGCPPRLRLQVADIQADLDRRRPGQSRLVTQRDEADRAEILSGLLDGFTTGTPLAVLVRNTDHRPNAYDHLRDVYRPSHADFTYDAKYGLRHGAGGGRASARETVGRVAAGAVARRLLHTFGVEVLAWVTQVGQIDASIDPDVVTLQDVEADPTRCPDPLAATAITAAIQDARKAGDSLGGIVRCIARGVPPGLGDPVFAKLDATLSAGLMSLPAAKGIEIGSGFVGTRLTGRQHNDPFEPDGKGGIRTRTNHSGGIQGGISNGAHIDIRVAFKPTSTIAAEQDSVTRSGKVTTLAARGRHDPCVLPRAVPMVESMVLITLADHWLRQRALDALPPLHEHQ